MAGFSNIGESGYQLQPPTLGTPFGSPGFTNLSIPHPVRQYSPYYSPEQSSMSNAADTGEQHRMNIYLAQNGLGDTGQANIPGYSDYGFSPEDWNNITRFLSNPLSNQNIAGYQGLTNRLGNVANTNPQFSLWSPAQRSQWSRDMPIRTVSGFGAVPAPILQNWGLAYPPSSTSNLRF